MTEEDQKHEFSPGGRHDDRVEEDNCCGRCGQGEEHADHKEHDGSDYYDVNSVFARMRADGSLAPRVERPPVANDAEPLMVVASEAMNRFRADPKVPEKHCSGCGTAIRGIYASVPTRRRTHHTPADLQAKADAEGYVISVREYPDVCSVACLRTVQATWPRHPKSAWMLEHRPKYEEHGQIDPYGAEIDGDLVRFGVWKATLPERST